MKKTDIDNLRMKEFIDLLSEENWKFIKDCYPSFERALETYWEGAEGDTSGEDSYLDVNPYFDIFREEEGYGKDEDSEE